MDTSVPKGCEDLRHAGMEEIGQYTATRGFAGDVIETQRRQVREKDLSATTWFPAYILWEVPDGHIYRVGSLAAKYGKLCLVRGNDDWDDGGAWLRLLEFLLQES